MAFAELSSAKKTAGSQTGAFHHMTGPLIWMFDLLAGLNHNKRV